MPQLKLHYRGAGMQPLSIVEDTGFQCIMSEHGGRIVSNDVNNGIFTIDLADSVEPRNAECLGTMLEQKLPGATAQLV